MDTVLSLAFLFCLGSMIGWVLEFFYRRIVGGHWVNPGFLRGPYLPIYGLGTLVLYSLCLVPLDFIPVFWLSAIVRILLMGAAMTAVEYVGGIIFVKGMNIKLWDYSQNFGNIQGVICPLFSAIWTAIGALYYFFLHRFFLSACAWFLSVPHFSFFVGMFYGVFLVDLVVATRLSLRIRKFAADHRIVVRYEEFKADVQGKLKTVKEKLGFFLSFITPAPLEEFLKKYARKKRGKEETPSEKDLSASADE